MKQTYCMLNNDFEQRLARASTIAQVLQMIHLDLPTLPARDQGHLFPMAYGKLEAVAATGEEGCQGGRGVARVEELT